MTKRWLGIIGACMMLCMTACGQESDYLLSDTFRTEDYLPRYDMQAEYQSAAGTLQRSGERIYSLSTTDGYLRYYDQSTGESGKLCDKQDCGHQDTTCNAYFLTPKSVQVYDGMLYVASAGTLYKLPPDGSQRETVMEIPLISSDAVGTVYIHRGYVYTSVGPITSEHGQSQQEYTLWQQQLGQSDSKKAILGPKTYGKQMSEKWMLSGNDLYLYLSDSGQGVAEFYRYQVAGGQLETLPILSEGMTVRDFMVQDHKLYWLQADSQAADDGGRNFQLVTYDLHSQKQTVEWTHQTQADRNIQIGSDGILIYAAREQNLRLPWTILNFQGEEIASDEPLTQRETFLTAAGHDSDGWYFRERTLMDSHFVLERLQNGSMQRLIVD